MNRQTIRKAVSGNCMLEFPLIVRFIDHPDVEGFNQRMQRVVGELRKLGEPPARYDGARIGRALDGIASSVSILQELIDLAQFLGGVKTCGNGKE